MAYVYGHLARLKEEWEKEGAEGAVGKDGDKEGEGKEELEKQKKGTATARGGVTPVDYVAARSADQEKAINALLAAHDR